MKLKLLLFFFFTFSIASAQKKGSIAADKNYGQLVYFDGTQAYENIAENGYVSIKK